MNVIFQGEITTTETVKNMPVGSEVNVLTDEDLTLAFFIPEKGNPKEGVYAPAEALAAPGGTVEVPSQWMVITTATTANVLITISNT